jgi:hypothetical protein
MKYKDLRDFIQQLEAGGELKRIQTEVDANLEIIETRSDSTLKERLDRFPPTTGTLIRAAPAATLLIPYACTK